MKLDYKHAALAAAMAMAMALGTAHAQDRARTDRADAYSSAVSYRDYLKGNHLRASELVGARVRNAAGDTLGEIEELVIPTRAEDDMLVVVSVGGVLDIGDKLVALPYDDLRVSPDGDTFYIDRTEEQLKAAPAFAYDAVDVEARADRAVASDDRPAARDDRPVVRDDRDVDADDRRADRDDRRVARDDRPVDRDARPATRDDRQADTPRAPAAPARAVNADRPANAAPSTAVRSTNVVLDVFDYRASDLIGATVLDDRGESVAKVDDIVVSMDDDKLHAVLAIGGFAGFGAKLISIPVDDLRITADGDTPQVRIAMTGEQLEQLLASRAEFRYERQVAQGPADAPRG